MRITVWGCRGSLPTPGPETLRYGGNTTCIEVEQDDGPPVIIDAGTGLRALGQRLAGSGVREVFHYAQYRDDEYDSRRGWGHSKLSSVVELAVAAGVGRLGLFHHDPDRSDDEVDRMVEECRDLLREAGTAIECFAASEGMVLEV